MTTHVKSKIVITVGFVYPPIPDRNYDYQVTFDDYDGAPDAGYQNQGWGRSVGEALIDFYNNYEDWFDEPLCAHRPMVLEDF